MRHEPFAASQAAQALGLMPPVAPWEPRDPSLNKAVNTAAAAKQSAIEADPSLVARELRLSKVPLDSPGGQSAVASAVKKLNLPATPDMVEFFSESWEHPRLESWGKANGFIRSTDPGVTLDAQVGHFDHAPYALNSTFGRNAVPTPFQTTRYGQVFLVEYDRRNKASVITTQVRDDVVTALKDSVGRGATRPFPSRFRSDESIGFELLHHLNDLREGLGVSQQLGNSREYGSRLIDSAKVALAMAIGSEFRERIQLASIDQAAKDTVLTALKRLEPLGPVLRETQEAWEEENQHRQEWRDDLHARIAASEARERAAEDPDQGLFV